MMILERIFHDSINQIIEKSDSLNLKIKSLKSSKENNILKLIITFLMIGLNL